MMIAGDVIHVSTSSVGPTVVLYDIVTTETC